jgi:Hg(II)-responsive transcriptional regulator
MSSVGLTIGRLARAAGVGIETIRYYQRRELLPVPETEATFRVYPTELIDRIQFIKRAQELGFSLDEISMFLQLADGTDRKSIRKIASNRLDEIRAKIKDLQKMEKVLAELVQECEATGQAAPCPVIKALAEKDSKNVTKKNVNE